jgi:cytochrome c oxidase subunit II
MTPPMTRLTLAAIPAPLTDRAETVSDVWRTFLPLAAGVLGLVVVLVLYVAIRFRRRDDRLPPQTRYRPAIEVAYTVVPLLVVIVLFAVTVRTISTVDATVADPDLVVDVEGFQWQWRFTYPDSGVVVTGDDPEAVPVGELKPPELVLPAGATVRFNLSSRDVIHSFWVPGFLFKRDAIPGSPTSFDVTVTDEPGVHPGGACAEFCGLYHARMLFTVRIVEPTEFDRWLADHRGDDRVQPDGEMSP